ncbi:MAG: hypothetical protein RL721_2105 [Candidatus Eisenbacteria bacterium]|jgi:opacity protein-like surface antigen
MTSLVHTARARSLPVALLAAALCLVTVSSAAAQPWPNTHQGWFLGFGVGGGSAQLSFDKDHPDYPGETTDRETGGAGSFRFGYDFTPQLGFGLESIAWAKSQTVDDMDILTTIGVAGPTLYWHPENTGFVLRGGAGLGMYRESASISGMDVTISNSGFGVLVGAAYQFRVKRTFSIGPEVAFGYAVLDKYKAQTLNAGLSFDWHFIPR